MNEIEITTKILDTASLPPLPYLHQTSFLQVSRRSCQLQHFNFLFYRSELKFNITLTCAILKMFTGSPASLVEYHKVLTEASQRRILSLKELG